MAVAMARACAHCSSASDVASLSEALKRRKVMHAQNLVEELAERRVKMDELPPLSACRSFFDYCRREKRMDVAVSLLKMMPKNEKYLSVAMSSCSRAKDWKNAQETFRLWSEPTSFAYSGIIAAANQTGHWDEALSFFDKAVDRGAVSVSVCNAAIESFCRKGQQEEAQAILERMKDWGLQPNTRSYNSLIRAAARVGDVEEALRYKERMTKEGTSADEYTYTGLLHAIANGSTPETKLGFDLLMEMQMKEIHVGGHALSSLFCACAKSGCEVDRAIQIFQGYMASNGPDPGAMSSYVAMCVKTNMPDAALEVYTKLKTHLHMLDPFTAASLCSAVAMLKNESVGMELYVDCLPLLGIVHKDVALGGFAVGNTVWNREQQVLFNSLVHMCGKVGMIDEVSELYAAMQDGRGPPPDPFTFNSLINAFAIQGDVESAVAVLDFMLEVEQSPSAHTFASLLHGCATSVRRTNSEGKGQELILARAIFQKSKDFGIVPNTVLYTALIDVAVKCEAYSDAFALFEEMQLQNIMPSVVTYGCLISGCEKLADPALAMKFYQMMCSNRLCPSDECHNILIKIHSRAGRLDDALELVKQVARSRGEMQQQTLNSVIRALSTEWLDRALRLASLMKTFGMTPSRKTFLTLMEACDQRGRLNTAFSVYEEMCRLKYRPSRQGGSGLIESLCKAGDLQRALQVYQHMSDESVSGFGGIHTESIIHLTIACAKSGRIALALSFYDKVRPFCVSLPGRACKYLAFGPMFEALIEALCRRGMISEALSTYDDMKASEAQISFATLAFLENMCRRKSCGIPEWRVYDVCASMRTLQESCKQSILTWPEKSYHHGPAEGMMDV